MSWPVVTPLNARSTYRRYCKIAAIGAALFVISVWIRVIYMDCDIYYVCIGAVAAGVGIYSVRFVWNEGWPLKMFCPSCGKYVSLAKAWRCGQCDAKNDKFHACSLLLPCVQCGQEARAYRCPHPHCGTTIFFDLGKDASHVAVKWSSPPPAETAEEARARLVDEREQRQHAIAVTRLDAELALEQQKLKAVAKTDDKKKSPKELLEENFDSFRTMTLGAEDLAAREMKHAELEYKDDPEKLERYKLVVTAWRDRNLK